jgi:hypothetical protein
MKPEEKLFWETFITVRPEFLAMKSWIPGPEPPDVIITDASDRKLGIELTEWLDKHQTTPSISTTENEMKWLNALDSENSPPPQHFQSAHLWFRSGTRFSQREKASFRKEFYELISHVDGRWEREMAGTPQKIWNDFSKYPMLGKHLHLIRFEDRMPFKPQRWALGTPKGGAYDPRWATVALLDRIEEKKSKPNYSNLKTQYGLAELVLLLHYGIRGLLHNAPFEGAGWKIEDAISEVRGSLAINSGPFDRVFLYLAYNEGRLFTLYP